MKSSYLVKSLFFPITVVCFATFLLSFVSVTLSVSLGIGLSFWLIMRAKPDGLLGLLLLYFSRYYFYDATALAVDYDLRSGLSVGSFPLEVQTVMCFFVPLRVILEKIKRPSTFRNKFPASLFILWLIAFVPVLIGFYLGYQERNPNWTRGLRWLMIAGSYFYGYILLKNWPEEGGKKLIVVTIVASAAVMLVLMNLKLYWSHHGFLFLGLGGAFSIYYLRYRSISSRLFGAGLLFMVVFYAAKATFTTIGITALAVLFSYLGSVKRFMRAGIRRRLVKLYGTIAVASILLFTAGVLYTGSQPDYIMSISSAGYDDDFAGKLESKTLSDRLIFWYAAYEQILSGPHFIVPSGTPLFLNVPGLPATWEVGAHNVILETLRLNGLFAGTVILIIYFLALKNNLLVLSNSGNPLLRTLAAAVLATGIAGITTGDFPADMTVGFWLWCLAGLCHGLFLREGSPPPNMGGSLRDDPTRQPATSAPVQQMSS